MTTIVIAEDQALIRAALRLGLTGVDLKDTRADRIAGPGAPPALEA